MGGRVLGRSVINVPSAVVTRLMTLLSDDMLGAHPRGAWLEQLQAPLAPPSSILHVSSPKSEDQDNVFHPPAAFWGLPCDLEMGKLIIPLKQIGIISINVLKSRMQV